MENLQTQKKGEAIAELYSKGEYVNQTKGVPREHGSPRSDTKESGMKAYGPRKVKPLRPPGTRDRWKWERSSNQDIRSEMEPCYVITCTHGNGGENSFGSMEAVLSDSLATG